MQRRAGMLYSCQQRMQSLNTAPQPQLFQKCWAHKEKARTYILPVGQVEGASDESPGLQQSMHKHASLNTGYVDKFLLVSVVPIHIQTCQLVKQMTEICDK